MFTLSNPIYFIPDMYYLKKPGDADFVRNISNFYAFGQAGMSVHFTRVSYKHSNYFIATFARKLNEGCKYIII
jgi:hypothetical protein